MLERFLERAVHYAPFLEVDSFYATSLYVTRRLETW